MARKSSYNYHLGIMVFNDTFEGLFKCFTNEEIGILLKALMVYNNTGDTIEMPDKVIGAFVTISAQISRNNRDYDEYCEKNRAIAKAGYKANASERNQTLANASERNPNYNTILPKNYITEKEKKEKVRIAVRNRMDEFCKNADKEKVSEFCKEFLVKDWATACLDYASYIEDREDALEVIKFDDAELMAKFFNEERSANRNNKTLLR